MNTIEKNKKLKRQILDYVEKKKQEYIKLEKNKRIEFIEKMTSLLFDYRDLLGAESIIYIKLVNEQAKLCQGF